MLVCVCLLFRVYYLVYVLTGWTGGSIAGGDDSSQSSTNKRQCVRNGKKQWRTASAPVHVPPVYALLSPLFDSLRSSPLFRLPCPSHFLVLSLDILLNPPHNFRRTVPQSSTPPAADIASGSEDLPMLTAPFSSSTTLSYKNSDCVCCNRSNISCNTNDWISS